MAPRTQVTRLVALAVVTLWAIPALAQVRLSLSADAGGGYDSNLYFDGGALPDDVETYGAGYIGVLPRATLVVGPLANNYLLLSYQADLRQTIGDDLDNETALSHWLMLGYQPPPLLGIRLMVAGGMTQLYLRNLPEGGWMGAVGFAQLSRNLGTEAVALSLSYVANYTDYSEESSADWTLSHTAQLAGAWKPGGGVKVSPYYAFSFTDADTPDLRSLGHMAGLSLGWTLPWLPVSLEVGYDFIALQLRGAVAGQQMQPPQMQCMGDPSCAGMGPGPGTGPGPWPGALPGVVPGKEDRTDYLHRGKAQVRVKILDWLEAFATWESLWGASNLVDDYARHQALGGLTLRWGYGSPSRGAAAMSNEEPARPDLNISLVFRDPAARAVSVVGTFNGWDPASHPMAREDGAWRVTVAPPPGIHQYMIWVDGEVRPPPGCRRWLDDGFGGKNCVLFVGGEG